MLASLPGVYVPEGLAPVYRQGNLIHFEVQKGFRFPVSRQIVHLDHFETRTFLYTPSSYFRKTALIEVNRGCAYRCRFCAGSFLYAPLRQRSLQLVLNMLDHVFPWVTKIGLVGSDILSYPHWRELVDYFVRNGKELTCSSLSGRRLIQDESLLAILRRGGLRTLTIAPESGNCMLRKFLGKGLQNEEWRTLISRAARAGFDKIKLYFMLGKPNGGVEEDVEFLKEITKLVSPSKIAVSYSFLVPKPHTPLQDFAPPPLQVWKREKEEFEGHLRKLKIRVFGESPRFAFLELLLARGDRLLAEKIPEVLAGGGSLSLWRKVLQSLKRDPEEWPRCPWGGGTRPWDMVAAEGGEAMG
ncbi:MAG: radical SAM protein, partial [Atribacterota bacterium]|nr:radical SAM protein [Atribacterota bacterium]